MVVGVGVDVSLPMRPMAIAGTQYTLSLSMAAALGVSGGWGGDTNGEIVLLCIPACSFPISGFDRKDDDYPVLASGGPTGGLVGNGPWKQFSMTFTPASNCPAVMIGPAITQTIASSPSNLAVSYVFYDALNLQETGTANGECDASNECIPI